MEVHFNGLPISILVQQLGRAGRNSSWFCFNVVLHVEILDDRIDQLWLGQCDHAVVGVVNLHSQEIANCSLIFYGEVLLGQPEGADGFINGCVHSTHENAIIYVDEEHYSSLVVQAGVHLAWFESCFLESSVRVLVPNASCHFVAIDVV